MRYCQLRYKPGYFLFLFFFFTPVRESFHAWNIRGSWR
jgi:hypothetical protein